MSSSDWDQEPRTQMGWSMLMAWLKVEQVGKPSLFAGMQSLYEKDNMLAL